LTYEKKIQRSVEFKLKVLCNETIYLKGILEGIEKMRENRNYCDELLHIKFFT